MSAFIIFLIVVNIGYVLYYAAIITIDMNVKGKQTNDKDQTIDTDGLVEQSDEDDDLTDEEPSIPVEQYQGDDIYTSKSTIPESETQNDENINSDNTMYPVNGNMNTADMRFDITDDNPYGLTDDDDNPRSIERIVDQQRADSNNDDDNKVADDETESESKEAEIRVFEPQPSDYATTLNAQGEPITAESTMPIRPEMMATTLLKAHNIIKQDFMKVNTQHHEADADKEDNHDDISNSVNSDVDNGISHDTEVFDKI